MRSLPLAILSLAFGATAASSALAQKAPNFSGTWVMVLGKSDFGGMPGAPESRTDKIEHKETSIVIHRTQSPGPMGGKLEATLTYGIDGKPYKNTIGENDVTSTLSWDGPVLVVESTVTTQQGPAQVTYRWSLSADGKTLTQERKFSMGNQKAAQKIVFAKQ